MKFISLLFAVASSLLLFGVATAQEEEPPKEYHEIYDTIVPNVVEVEYTDPYDNDFELLGYASVPESETPLPAVVIIPDFTNVDAYEKVRATMIAEQFGWIGFAADVFGPNYYTGDGQPGSAEFRAQAGIYRSNNTLFAARVQAAVDAARAHPAVDESKVAVIGYCFGGTGVLTYAFLGGTGVIGAVSVHGGLTDFAVTSEIPYPVQVLSGGADDTGTEVDFLEAQLNSANSTWQITRYSGIEHAFTKWHDRRYNERADIRSWREMSTFLAELFGEISYGTTQPESTEVTQLDYDDNGFDLTGFLAIPPGADMDVKHPAVVIVPDWDGVSGPDGYESERATLLAEAGYIALAADIYGSNLTQVETFEERIQLVGRYRGDYQLFVSRIQAAVNVVANHELVDANNIFMIGYCFGGTGAVNYAFSGLDHVKAIVPFHGGLTGLAPIQTDVIAPYVLVQSGGIDDAHGNNTELEMALDGANATWEITRYSNVEHGFTDWHLSAYNDLADWRSWDAMFAVFDMILESETMPTITDLAVATEDLSILTEFVVLAGLAETLAGPGPFTVFAPTNAAFEALDPEVVDALVNDPEGVLTDILLYHVVPGVVMAKDLVDGAMVETVTGAMVMVSLEPVMINNATVVVPDVMVSNGVVHLIDMVLVPGEDMLDGPPEESEDELLVTVGRDGDPDMP